MKRVVITGIGAVTPLGINFSETWEALKAGRSGIGTCSRFSTKEIPWQVVGEIRDFDARTCLSEKEEKRFDLFIQYALSSVLDAIEDSSLEPKQDTMVIMGSSRGGIGGLEAALQGHLLGGKRISAYVMPATSVSMAHSLIAQKLRLKGHSLGISQACASGAVAVGETYRLIRDGYGKVAIAGGAEAPLCRLCLEGYGRMGALSQGRDSRASRPFDRDRDGFILSEGASVLIIEEMEHALRRGTKIYAEISGYAQLITGGYGVRPNIDDEVCTMTSALEMAAVTPAEVDMVSAHGTSTVSGDRVEAEALQKIFGENIMHTAITAQKSSTGHMLGASAALEVACTAKSIAESIIPPTINTRTMDSGHNLSVTRYKEERSLKVAMSNSFGFGGVNAVLVLKKI